MKKNKDVEKRLRIRYIKGIENKIVAMKYRNKIFFLAMVIFGMLFFVLARGFFPRTNIYHAKPDLDFWNIKSVDTMKYSRDLSREKLEDASFDGVIDEQVKNIASVGATHVAIATPYDQEFLPMLKRWVSAARKYKLKVWFRGNWSGWEEWFDYPKITRNEHMRKTKGFILSNADIFEDGDIFSSCPECENGGPGDPRSTGDVEGFRKFIISEYREAKRSFASINKKVQSNYFSMNADVAKLVMDKETTATLDGIVTIDHYVGAPEQLARDVEEIADESGGRIVLGEFGVPIPDINGEMSGLEQAEWIDKALWILKGSNRVNGINYWSNVGGTTAIWEDDGNAKEAVNILKKYFNPKVCYGIVYNELDNVIPNVKVLYSGKEILTDSGGYFEFPYVADTYAVAKISAPGYLKKEIVIDQRDIQTKVVLIREKKDLRFKLAEFLKNISKGRY